MPGVLEDLCDERGGGGLAVGAGHGDDAAGADLKKRLHLAGDLRPGGTQPAKRRDLRVHPGRAEDDVCPHIVEIPLADVQHRARLFQLQHLRVELLPRRFVAGQHVNAARKEHADERTVADADTEDGDLFIGKRIKILIDKRIHKTSLF